MDFESGLSCPYVCRNSKITYFLEENFYFILLNKDNITFLLLFSFLLNIYQYKNINYLAFWDFKFNNKYW